LAVRVVAVTTVGVRTSTLRHRGGPIQKPIVAFDDATTPVLPNYKVGALRKLAERGIISPTRIVRLLSDT